ncbi:MAG TPA: alpha/beta hydrolase-fold protein [Planctomycetota bacterium]|nr:alpha/beta hydrolase-fold protein [Planctomycetota bacterium]
MTANTRLQTVALGLELLGSAITVAESQQAPPVDFTKFSPWTAKADEGDYVLGPPYANAPELTPKDGVPKGMVFHLTINSTDSKMYPGISKTAPGTVVPYQRRLTVYVPSQYIAGKPAPLIVSQDSMGQGELPTILDNMIADHRLPPIVAVMIDSGGGDAQGSERGLEYDTVSGKYAEFIETEVLPKISQDCKVTFTKDPEGRMTMGGSSGAACAFTMAWFHPEWYHRVLSYSGTFVNQQSPLNRESPHGAWEYHENLILKTPAKPLRIWMHVGEMDNRYKDPESTFHNWVLANQRMAGVFKARKYHYQFVFARESGHVDGKVVRQTLPQALEWVWRGYKAK